MDYTINTNKTEEMKVLDIFLAFLFFYCASTCAFQKSIIHFEYKINRSLPFLKKMTWIWYHTEVGWKYVSFSYLSFNVCETIHLI